MATVDTLLEQVLVQRGSDLHLGIGFPPLARVRGELVPLRAEPVEQAEMESLLFEVCTDAQRQKLTEEWDLDFAYDFADKARCRVNYFFKTSGLAAVFRVIPARVPSLAEVGAPDIVRKLAERRSGFIVVAGPTGSGKSTTLAAMLNHINQTRACHIITVEDPVEYVHQPIRAQVTHREIGPHAPNFATAIRSAGREDPNVILIGELRTAETVKMALQLASYGVLVLGTVNTTSSAGAVDRVINSFPPAEQPQVRGMLGECLAAVIAQQLVRTADGTARIPAHEVLIGTSGVASLIRESKTSQIPSAIQTGASLGMQSLDGTLEKLVTAGRVRPEDALEKAADRELFQQFLQRRQEGASAAPEAAPAEPVKA